MRARIGAISMAVTAMLSARAVAGPEYTEPPGDAGSTKASAASATMIPGSGHITGSLSGVALVSEVRGAPDFEDMYIIEIQQPGRWQVTTSPLVGRHSAFAEFDSVLWLFEYEDERGLLANHDRAASDQGARLRNFSTDGTGIVVDEPGLYLLAISVVGRRPVDMNGQPLFQFLSTTEVSGPDGSPLPLHHWMGSPVNQTPGSYVIEISVPPCPGDVDSDGTVGLADIAAVIMHWGETVPAWFDADLDGNGMIGLGDIARVISYWGQPCL
ncbi:MAG TPA: hypothetical protein VG797_00200 [Phycisphaerales bacterium]|nr:hypothetical protein [Phycisphaerales bacterium]